MKVFVIYIISLFLCSQSVVAYAQVNLTDYESKYPNANGIFLKKNEHAVISIDKNGEPIIETNYDEERVFLNENYKYYTEESVNFSSFTSIESISPVVYIPEDGKYKKVKITEIMEEDATDGSVFHDDLKKKKFFYRGLTKGGRTTLSYTKELSEPHFFGTFYFSSYLPVEASVYEIQTPADMNITFELFGDEKDKVKYKEEIKGKYKIHRWEANNLNEIEVEDQSVSIKNYATHLQVYINSYKFKNEEKHILRNLDDLYKYYRNFVREVNEEENPELERLADSLVKGKSTNEEKVKAILYWVQDNIKYIAFEAGMGGFIPRKAALVCDRKYGDCKDMSSILYTMINSVGIPAYYTWIGTRDIPYTYKQVPTPATDNHMICSYFDGEKYIFLDATGKGLPYGMPTAFIQGKEALIGINETEYKIVEVPALENTSCITVDTVYASIVNGVIKGTGKVVYNGYSSVYLSDHINNLSEKEKEDFFSYSFRKGNNKCKSVVSEIRGSHDRESSLEIDYSFDLPDYVRENENELYLNPFLNKYLSGDKINLETNKHDKKNTFKEISKNLIYFKIPEGYVVDFLPEGVVYNHEKFGCVLSVKHLKDKNEIEIKMDFDYNHMILRSEEFVAWNEMIKKINQVYSELIILKKQ